MSDAEKDDVAACQACGKPEHLHLLDAKDATGSGDFERLECIACYGPGWAPCAMEHLSLSVRPELAPVYAMWDAQETAIRTLQRREDALRSVARRAAQRFRDYERLHMAKDTAEGLIKARSNADIAGEIEDALKGDEP